MKIEPMNRLSRIKSSNLMKWLEIEIRRIRHEEKYELRPERKRAA